MFTTATATKIQPPLTPSPELRRLDIFVGKWHREGLSYGSGQSQENPHDSAVRWPGEESFEWLPGGFFLAHYWNGQIGDAVLNGVEIIGYDAASQTYSSRIFDNYGRIHIGQRSVRDGVWTYTRPERRSTLVFSDDGNTMTTRWEWLSGEGWLVWIDLKAAKVS